MSNLYQLFQARFEEHGAKVLLETERRAYTGAELDAAVAAYAAALAGLGLRAGERLAAQVEKSAENLLLYLACLRLGAVYLPLNTAYQPAEVAYFLGDAQPRILAAAPERRAALEGVAKQAGVRLVTLGAAGEGELAGLAAEAAARPHTAIAGRDDGDLAVICYTSGTTGRSKGAMITHGNLASNARTLVELWGFSADDTLLHALPLYHIHGLFVALHCAFLSGARTVLQARFAPAAVLERLPQCSVMMGVPTFYTRLLAEPALDAARCRNTRLFISGSAPLLADTFKAFEARTGKRILERYGMTETGMISSNPLHGERRAGTVGLPLPGVAVRITGDDGDPLPAGQRG
jgi:malonyl-CoA/methylmalonyl-CoA synthetase